MEIRINDNVYLKSLKTKKDLREIILKMIIESKVDKILYKGNPLDINYKLLKKLIVPKKILKTEKNINVEEVKQQFTNILQELNDEEYCIIYKK
jgi:hypothetical protein